MSDQEGTSSATDAQAADDAGTQAQAADTDAQGGAGDDATSLSPEDARKLRSEARALRQRLKTAEDELRKRSDADLTEQQRVERELAAEKAGRQQLETEVRNLRVQVAAGKLGVRPEAVARVGALIDWDDVQDASDAKQVERAIRELLKEMPFLSSRPDGLDGGAGRGAGAKGETDMNSIIRRAAGRA